MTHLTIFSIIIFAIVSYVWTLFRFIHKRNEDTEDAVMLTLIATVASVVVIIIFATIWSVTG